MKFSEWLKEFTKGKEEVDSISEVAGYAVHSIRRYLGPERSLLEIGITYTGRVVSREGIVKSDGITITWKDWTTHHDVEIKEKT